MNRPFHHRHFTTNSDGPKITNSRSVNPCAASQSSRASAAAKLPRVRDCHPLVWGQRDGASIVRGGSVSVSDMVSPVCGRGRMGAEMSRHSLVLQFLARILPCLTRRFCGVGWRCQCLRCRSEVFCHDRNPGQGEESPWVIDHAPMSRFPADASALRGTEHNI
jgi:hypothetical protein